MSFRDFSSKQSVPEKAMPPKPLEGAPGDAPVTQPDQSPLDRSPDQK
ncbi:hypothetical protein [Thalassospira australica]